MVTLKNGHMTGPLGPSHHYHMIKMWTLGCLAHSYVCHLRELQSQDCNLPCQLLTSKTNGEAGREGQNHLQPTASPDCRHSLLNFLNLPQLTYSLPCASQALSQALPQFECGLILLYPKSFMDFTEPPNSSPPVFNLHAPALGLPWLADTLSWASKGLPQPPQDTHTHYLELLSLHT